MKIEGNQPQERIDISDVNAKKTPKIEKTENTSPTGKEAGVTDKVDLSAQAKEISKIKTAMNQIPDVREEEVDAIKKAIETDSYSLDSLKIADKILKEI